MELHTSQMEMNIEINTRHVLQLLYHVDASSITNTVMAFARYLCKQKFSEMTSDLKEIDREFNVYNLKQKLLTINLKGMEKKMNSAIQRYNATEQLLLDLMNGISVVDLKDFQDFYISVDHTLCKMIEENIERNMIDKVLCIYKKYYNLPLNKSKIVIGELREMVKYKFDTEYKKITDIVQFKIQENLFQKGSEKLFLLARDLGSLSHQLYPVTEATVHPRETVRFCCKNRCFECEQFGTQSCYY